MFFAVRPQAQMTKDYSPDLIAPPPIVVDAEEVRNSGQMTEHQRTNVKDRRKVFTASKPCSNMTIIVSHTAEPSGDHVGVQVSAQRSFSAHWKHSQRPVLLKIP